jgi:hypothetical protein
MVRKMLNEMERMKRVPQFRQKKKNECEHIECSTTSRFGYPFGEARYCLKHKREFMVNLKIGNRKKNGSKRIIDDDDEDNNGEKEIKESDVIIINDLLDSPYFSLNKESSVILLDYTPIVEPETLSGSTNNNHNNHDSDTDIEDFEDTEGE